MTNTTDFFDFTTPIDRRGSDSLKWARYADRDILPLWVADMDFASPPAVRQALADRVAEGVYGYGTVPAGLEETACAHLLREYQWHIEPEWIVWLPGLVVGLNVACRTVVGDVITATPVYPPFLSAPLNSGRKRHTVPLTLDSQRWQWDFDALISAFGKLGEDSLFLLCHPHNPVGRAWEEEELRHLGALCRQHGLIVCSDEIHCGLILDQGKRHRPFAALDEELAESTITLMAPSKTYNVPGLGCAFAVIANPELRQRFQRAMRGIVPDVNVFGFVACAAALEKSDDWHRQLIATLANNRDRVFMALADEPLLATTRVEATYLAWIDARPLAARLEEKFGRHSALANPARFFEEHGVGLSDGIVFATGEDGKNWLRLNFGCPLTTLDEALKRMKAATAGL